MLKSTGESIRSEWKPQVVTEPYGGIQSSPPSPWAPEKPVHVCVVQVCLFFSNLLQQRRIELLNLPPNYPNVEEFSCEF